MYHHCEPIPTTGEERPTKSSQTIASLVDCDADRMAFDSGISGLLSRLGPKEFCCDKKTSHHFDYCNDNHKIDIYRAPTTTTNCNICQHATATLHESLLASSNVHLSSQLDNNDENSLNRLILQSRQQQQQQQQQNISTCNNFETNITSDQQPVNRHHKQQSYLYNYSHNQPTITEENKNTQLISSPIRHNNNNNNNSKLLLASCLKTHNKHHQISRSDCDKQAIMPQLKSNNKRPMLILSILLASVTLLASSLLPSTSLLSRLSLMSDVDRPIILYANAQQHQHFLHSLPAASSSKMVVLNKQQSTKRSRSKRFSDYEQSFEVQPEATYYPHLGLDLRIRCIIRRRQGECSWLRNGRVVGQLRNKYEYLRTPDDGDCSLLIRNVSMSTEDGTWQCQVTAQDIDHEPLISRELQVVVLVTPERPVIKNTVTNSQRLIVEENKQKMIICEIKGGNPPPNIEWFLDGRNITKEAVQYTTNATTSASRTTVSRLKMGDVKRQMNGKNLTCSGWHPTLNQSSTVELDVHYIPTVSVGQREHSIVEGSPLSITCNVDSNPPPSIISWRLVTDGSTPGSSIGKHNSQQAITSPTRAGPLLEFNSISRDLNQNIFECLAQNSYGVSHPTDVKLNVLYAPVLLNTSHSESVSLGQRATLACIFEGNPEPEVKWFYTDPMSKYSQAFPLDNKSQYLVMQNVTYKQEGDYHCEAKNRINGYDYTVRSSNIILDVFGEPQFLVRSPSLVKAVQGSRADLTASFCSDPLPTKIYWQFGSIRLDVKLPSNGAQTDQQQQAASLPNIQTGNQQQQQPNNGNNQKMAALAQKYQIHSLQSLQKRDSSFSKLATCFEAQLTILEPELTDQRDYQLIVQNERGQQSAIIRMRVSSPLSPILMLSSAFMTIFALFVCSLVAMFVIRKRKKQQEQLDEQDATNSNTNINTNNGNGVLSQENINTSLASANGKQNGKLGGADALLGGQQLDSVVSRRSRHDSSTMGSNSNSTSQSTANSTPSPQSSPPLTGNTGIMSGNQNKTGSAALRHHLTSALTGATNNVNSNNSSTYQAAESINLSLHSQLADHHHHHINQLHHFQSANKSSLEQQQQQQHSTEHSTEQQQQQQQQQQQPVQRSSTTSSQEGLIYANLDFHDHQDPSMIHVGQQHQHRQMASPQSYTDSGSMVSQQHQQSILLDGNSDNGLALHNNHSHHHSQVISYNGLSVATPSYMMQDHSPNTNNTKNIAQQQTNAPSSVGATVAMMNSQIQQQQQVSSGSVNGVNQQQQSTTPVRKPGPPKPPKPIIHQRSKFYGQVAAAGGLSEGLIMKVQQQQQQNNNQSGNSMTITEQQASNGALYNQSSKDNSLANNEMSIEYARIAFPASAEL